MSGRNIRPLIFCPFRAFPRVGQGVGQAVDPHFDPHFFQRFYNKKAPKTEVFDAFGAAGRIRTADLILTNGTVALLKRIIAPQNPRFKSAFHCFSRHFVPYRSDPFYSNSSQIVVKKQVV